METRTVNSKTNNPEILIRVQVDDWFTACRKLKGYKNDLTNEEWTAIEYLSNFWRQNASINANTISLCNEMIDILKTFDKYHSNNRDISTCSKNFRNIAKAMYTQDNETYKLFRKLTYEVAGIKMADIVPQETPKRKKPTTPKPIKIEPEKPIEIVPSYPINNYHTNNRPNDPENRNKKNKLREFFKIEGLYYIWISVSIIIVVILSCTLGDLPSISKLETPVLIIIIFSIISIYAYRWKKIVGIIFQVALLLITLFISINRIADPNKTNSAIDKQETVRLDNQKVLRIGGHSAVDLGLSVKWATCNIGAKEIFENGELLNWNKNDEDSTINKNYTSQSTDFRYKSTLQPEIGGSKSDVVRNLWGKKWRMPTKKEFIELYTKCTSKWIKYHGIIGLEFVGKNGNAVFFPCNPTGKRNQMGYEEDYYHLTDDFLGRDSAFISKEGTYWTATFGRTEKDVDVDENKNFLVNAFCFNKDSTFIAVYRALCSDGSREQLYMRPVSKEK